MHTNEVRTGYLMSASDSKAATLYLIGTPIGNLSDLSSRTRSAMESCDLLLVEDTRVTIKLLNHLDIKKKMLSCYDFNERQRQDVLERAVREGLNIGLISDAGMPLVSDPGNFIVKAAVEAGMQIIAVPGPSAFLLALVASGLPTDRFVFEGFLPDKSGEAIKCLEALKAEERTVIFYVSPHKLVKTLNHVLEILGDRKACLARELTKLHEEYIRGYLSELVRKVQESALKGEFVLVVEGAEKNAATFSSEDIQKLLEECLSSGMSVKDSAHELSNKLNMQKSAIYKVALEVSRRMALDADS
jgi:16S rRNA (cytidine1402-2'-O)-methyltransferase